MPRGEYKRKDWKDLRCKIARKANSEPKKQQQTDFQERKGKKKMGVEKELLRPGTGPKPVPGQKVTVHCTGYG